jgi:hypothetical protein
MKFTLEVDDAQLQEIAQALELMARVKLGQFSHIETLFWSKEYNYMEFSKLSNQIKNLIFPELRGGYYGIYSDESKLSGAFSDYELYKQMLYEINKAKSISNVHSYNFTCEEENNKIKISVDKD